MNDLVNDPCDSYPCFNNGTCFFNLINDQKVPRCDCPENTDGQNCNLLYCNVNDLTTGRLPCYNGGTCTFEYIVTNPLEPTLPTDKCQCQENGKYHGESCEMPGRDACGGSPCQNDGTCTLIDQGEIQACF